MKHFDWNSWNVSTSCETVYSKQKFKNIKIQPKVIKMQQKVHKNTNKSKENKIIKMFPEYFSCFKKKLKKFSRQTLKYHVSKRLLSALALKCMTFQKKKSYERLYLLDFHCSLPKCWLEGWNFEKWLKFGIFLNKIFAHFKAKSSLIPFFVYHAIIWTKKFSRQKNTIK